MKTIEQKAKAYDGNYKVYLELINRLEDVKNAIKKHNYGIAMDILCHNYPEFQITTSAELQENKDDKIIKSLSAYFAKFNPNDMWDVDFSFGDIGDWIEKQGEKKSNPVLDIEIPFGAKDSELQEASYHIPEGFHAGIEGNRVVIKRGEKKPIDKVEPKFHEREWVFIEEIKGYKQGPFQIKSLSKHGYCFDEDRVMPFSTDDLMSLWTIQDAKDGDVLVHNGCTFIFMGVKNGIVQALEENLLGGTNPVCFGEPDKDRDYHPATKEQRETLFARMKEVGYEWDSEKKELKKIKPIGWIKEDMNIINGIIMDYEGEIEHLSDSTIDKQAKPVYQERINFLNRLKSLYSVK